MKKEKEGSFGDVYLGEHAFNFDHSVLSVEMTRMPSKKVTIPHTTWDLSFFFFFLCGLDHTVRIPSPTKP